MTYPTEFRNEAKTIGSSAILHPIYYFQVNLDLQSNELVGPITNQRSVNVLHPDQHQTSPDLGRAQRVVRRLQNHSWFASMSQAGNIDLKDDGTIVAYGSAGTYLKQNFTSGSNPLLTVLNDRPFVSLTPASEVGGAYMAGTADVQKNNQYVF